MAKKKLARIALSAYIVLIIAGIWVFKNHDALPWEATASPGPAASGQAVDFALEASELDVQVLTGYGLPIVIDFGADSCAPCREFKPILEAVHKQTLGRVIIKFIDTEQYPDIAENFPLQVIPTQIFISADGTPYVPGDDMDVDFTLYRYKDSGEHAFTAHQGGLTEEQMYSIFADMGVDE